MSVRSLAAPASLSLATWGVAAAALVAKTSHAEPKAENAPPTDAVASEAPLYVDDWPDDQPPPPGYRRLTEPRGWALKIGTNLFTGAYLALGIPCALEVKSTGDSSYFWGVVPLAGPFVMLRYSTSRLIDTVLYADGVAQGVGALLAVYGLAVPRTRLVREVGVSRLVTAPMVDATTLGLSVRGAF